MELSIGTGGGEKKSARQAEKERFRSEKGLGSQNCRPELSRNTELSRKTERQAELEAGQLRCTDLELSVTAKINIRFLFVATNSRCGDQY